jgi:hypothetical protein
MSDSRSLEQKFKIGRQLIIREELAQVLKAVQGQYSG